MTKVRRSLLFILLLAGCAALGAGTAGAEPWVPEIEGSRYFAVLVEDVDASAAWYREVFGLGALDDSSAPDGAWRILNLRNEALHVELIRDHRARKVDRARGFFKTGFGVPDVRIVADRIERLSGERPRVIDVESHGIRILQLKDPDGNTIQLSSPLASESVTDLTGQVFVAERAFAKTMADRDHAAFVTFLADEAVFLAEPGAKQGRDGVTERWRPYFETEQPPFSWEPETVEVLESGELAISTGPVLDPAGERVATFTSIWRREASGDWRVVFDRGTKHCE